MTYEELGWIILRSKRAKFPKCLLDEKLIRYSTFNTLNEDISNFELTEKALAILDGNSYNEQQISEEDFLAYYNKFTYENIGVNKTAYSPKQKVKTKLQNFMQKYKVEFSTILLAVDQYHRDCMNENRLTHSSDAQYFIEKDGGSFLLDTLAALGGVTHQQPNYKLV